MRMEGEITPEEYTAKRAELYDRQSAPRLQLERSYCMIADLAVKAIELSQSFQKRWLTADYNPKRTILRIVLETVRLNRENLEFSLRKPFDLLRNENLVTLIGASGTPIELFLAAVREIEPNKQVGVAAIMVIRR